MGPFVLLSLLGIGAASAFVEMSTAQTDADETPTDDDPNTDASGATDITELDTEDANETGGDVSMDGSAHAAPELTGTTLQGTDEGDSLLARGAENIDAGAGDDTLTSHGSGTLLAGEGNDTLELSGTAQGWGGTGQDYMHVSDAAAAYGGEGDDTFFMEAADADAPGPATADGGEGADTFLIKPLTGLPEDTVAHVLTGGAGADVYALDIDSAVAVRAGDEDDAQIVAHITDFDPNEDLLLVDLGATGGFDDVQDLPMPDITTTEDPDGAYTDVHFKWTNPENPDNSEIRTMRLEGVTGFSAGEVQITSVLNTPDTALTQPLEALTPTEGSDTDDALTLDASAATTLKDGDDALTMTSGSHLAYGGEGNDTLSVASSDVGAAHLFGGEGDDVITADLSDSADTALFGGAGEDSITFGMGQYVDAGTGSDDLVLNVHPGSAANGPAILEELSGNHLTINVPADMDGDLRIVNHTYSNGFEVAYSEVFVGDLSILKVLEEDFTNGIGISDLDPRLTIVRDASF